MTDLSFWLNYAFKNNLKKIHKHIPKKFLSFSLSKKIAVKKNFIKNML